MKWPFVCLGNITTLISSGSTPLGGAENYTATGEVMLIRSQNVQMGYLVLDDVAYISKNMANAMARTYLHKGDVLLNITGASIGRTAAFDLDTLANVNQHVCVIRPDGTKVDNRYLARFLASPVQQSHIMQQQHGGTRQALTFNQIAAFEIPLPPLPEQRRIADILDKADAIRRKRKEAIKLTEELLRSAFLEMFGDPVTNPKRWEVKALGDVADIASGATKGKDYGAQKTIEFPYMRVANVQDGHIVIDDVKTIHVSEADAQRYLLQVGDVLLTEGGDPDKLGRGAVWRGQIANCIHQNHIFRVRPRPEILPEYLSAIVGSERGKQYFLKAAKQTTGIATINMSQLKKFPVLVPPISLQTNYVKLMGRIANQRNRQYEALQNVNNLFSSLVDRAFRGELGAGPNPSTSTSTRKQLELFESGR